MIQSLERASDILHLFVRQKYWGVTQIAEQMQLSKSTVFGLVSSLEKLGFLEKNRDNDKYRLGLELYRLGNLVDGDLRQMIMPELSALVDSLEETINYVRPDGADVVYIVKKESPHSMRICTKSGQRLPMYSTAVGKAIMAYLPPEKQEELIAETTFKPYTSYTVSNAAQLRSALENVRSCGYALDCEELEYGLVCVAVPIFDAGRTPIAALSCSGPKMRMTEDKIRQCVERLQLGAEHLRELIVL